VYSKTYAVEPSLKAFYGVLLQRVRVTGTSGTQLSSKLSILMTDDRCLALQMIRWGERGGGRVRMRSDESPVTNMLGQPVRG
jgi:hypothetical protein